MAKEYIEERNGGLYVTGTRVSLDSVVHVFWEGATPETILQDFPALRSLENVYGAITYYLANRAKVDEYLKGQARKWEEIDQKAGPMPAKFREHLERMRLAASQSRED